MARYWKCMLLNFIVTLYTRSNTTYKQYYAQYYNTVSDYVAQSVVGGQLLPHVRCLQTWLCTTKMLISKDLHMKLLPLHVLTNLVNFLSFARTLWSRKLPTLILNGAIHTSNFHLFSMPFYIMKSVQTGYCSQLVCLPIPSNHTNYCVVLFTLESTVYNYSLCKQESVSGESMLTMWLLN